VGQVANLPEQADFSPFLWQVGKQAPRKLFNFQSLTDNAIS
jgi:hypothetical protein